MLLIRKHCQNSLDCDTYDILLLFRSKFLWHLFQCLASTSKNFEINYFSDQLNSFHLHFNYPTLLQCYLVQKYPCYLYEYYYKNTTHTAHYCNLYKYLFIYWLYYLEELFSSKVNIQTVCDVCVLCNSFDLIYMPGPLHQCCWCSYQNYVAH